jgi:hypothetical protein
MNWQQMLAYISGSVDEESLLRNEYLATENRILKRQIKGRLRLTDPERISLAEIGKRLGRKALEEVAQIVCPATILGWHRKLIAKKFDGSMRRTSVGRAPTEQAIEELVLKFARENRSWGYRRIVGAISNLGHEISHQTVANILKRHDLDPAPERGKRRLWKEFIRSHLETLAAVDFFTAEVWTAGGLTTYYVLVCMRIAPRQISIPGITLARSVKEECLSKLILFGEQSLRHVLSNYVRHYHEERNHQGKDNLILFPAKTDRIGSSSGKVQTRERLGGLLKFSHREAA